MNTDYRSRRPDPSMGLFLKGVYFGLGLFLVSGFLFIASYYYYQHEFRSTDTTAVFSPKDMAIKKDYEFALKEVSELRKQLNACSSK